MPRKQLDGKVNLFELFTKPAYYVIGSLKTDKRIQSPNLQIYCYYQRNVNHAKDIAQPGMQTDPRSTLK